MNQIWLFSSNLSARKTYYEILFGHIFLSRTASSTKRKPCGLIRKICFSGKIFGYRVFCSVWRRQAKNSCDSNSQNDNNNNKTQWRHLNRKWFARKFFKHFEKFRVNFWYARVNINLMSYFMVVKADETISLSGFSRVQLRGWEHCLFVTCMVCRCWMYVFIVFYGLCGYVCIR